MSTKVCYCCGGSGVVDKGTPSERECPFCWGMGYISSDDDDDDDD